LQSVRPGGRLRGRGTRFTRHTVSIRSLTGRSGSVIGTVADPIQKGEHQYADNQDFAKNQDRRADPSSIRPVYSTARLEVRDRRRIDCFRGVTFMLGVIVSDRSTPAPI